MRKFVLIFIVLTLFTCLAMADHAIPPVPETQGITTSTTIDAVGNFASASEIQWRLATSVALPDIPPLYGGIIESTYTEDTVSNGVGLIGYDKELDVETSGQITGQWNIEATKELSFIGIDGARVTSTDNIFVDGAGTPDVTEATVICPFASDITEVFPQYCNRAEAGSTIDMTVTNVRTTSTDRIVMPSSDHTVELNHDIRVSELVEDLPSIGMASASLEVLIQEAYGGDVPEPPSTGEEIYTQLGERIEFTEETIVDGDIALFEKLMHYESGMVR